jgi:hypothetical protein
MALKNRTGTAVYEYDGDTIKLAATFAAMEQLSDEVGMDALEYIQSSTTLREITELFFHLQVDTDYTREEIYNAFFAEVAIFEKKTIQEKLNDCLETVLGKKRAAMIKDSDAPKK